MKNINKQLSRTFLLLIIVFASFSSCIERTSDCSGCGNRPWAPNDGGACFETKEDCEQIHSGCQYCE